MNDRWHLRAWAADDEAAVLSLLHDQGWAHRVTSRDDLSNLITASSRVRVAEAEGRIVGFVRALTDGISNGYLSMLVVDGSWRRRGIGRALVEAVTGGDRRITWVLRAGRADAAAFFERIGFERSVQAMERRRTPAKGSDR